MEERLARTEMIIGRKSVEKLKNSKVAIYGIGGVGSYVVEALVRAGIGSFVLIDSDIVNESNINRQLIANYNTLGLPKVDVANQRIKSINPLACVETIQDFYLPKKADTLFIDNCDYIVDAIDTVTAKIDIIVRAKENNIPIISSMGTGNKLYPEMLSVIDIYNTTVCPLARVMRRELKKRQIRDLKVVASTEKPIKLDIRDGEEKVPGSISFVPATAGLLIAGEVIRDIISMDK